MERLSVRVERLEAEATPDVEQQEEVEDLALPTVAPGGSARLMTRLALGCFVLVGALVLRTAARQEWLSAALGTIIGLVYCGGLMVIPHLIWRRRGRWGSAAMLQICGGLLAVMIVLETTLRSHLLSVTAAAVILACVGLVAVLVGLAQRSSVLTALVLLGQVFGVVALGVSSQGAIWRGAALVLLAGLAMLTAHLRPWPFIRPLLLVPVGLALALGVLTTARREVVSTSVTPALLVCVVLVLVLVLVNVARRAALLDRFERGLVPLAASWAYGLAAFYNVEVAAPLGAISGLTALTLGRWLPADSEAVDRVRPGLVAAGGLLLLFALPTLDATGLALGLGALALQYIGRGRGTRLEPLLSMLIIVAATISALWSGDLLHATQTLDWRAPAGLGLTALVLAYCWTALFKEPGWVARWIAPVTMVCGAVVLFSSLRLLARHQLASDAAFGLAQTALLATMSMAVIIVGRWRGLRTLSYLGYAGIALLCGKVAALDLSRLEGAYLVGSVLCLGIVAAGAALILHFMPDRADEGEGDGEEGDGG